MTLIRAFLAVAGSTVICTAVGIGLGAGLGYFAPGYYRAVLLSGRSPGFDPVQIGIGFGLNAGVIAGIVIGLIIVAIVTYFELRTAEKRSSLPAAQEEMGVSSHRESDAIRSPGRWER